MGRQEIKSTQIKSTQMLVFGEKGKPEYPRKNLSEQSREPTTQPTYDIRSGNRTRATLMEGQCSHHGPNTAPLDEWKCTEGIFSFKNHHDSDLGNNSNTQITEFFLYYFSECMLL